MRRATARREIPPIATPSSATDPPVGASTPASSLSSVVLPDPLGPRIPSRAPEATSTETSRTTGRPGGDQARGAYANDRLRAEINTEPDHAHAARCGIAVGFLIPAVEEIETATEDLHVRCQAPGGARIDDRETGRRKHAAKAAE